ncbi:MAG: anti-sigma factor, partial [Aquimarina sp.]|nr:anti-sigma factor [Aquimarina sp.]
MDIKEYIESGILELYIYGSLTEKENIEVYEMLQKYPEIKEEVHRIESSLDQLSSAGSSADLEVLFERIKRKINESENNKGKVVELKKRSTNWPAYIGWAASIALLIGLFSQLNQNKELREEIVRTKIENQVLEGNITVA